MQQIQRSRAKTEARHGPILEPSALLYPGVDREQEVRPNEGEENTFGTEKRKAESGAQEHDGRHRQPVQDGTEDGDAWLRSRGLNLPVLHVWICSPLPCPMTFARRHAG